MKLSMSMIAKYLQPYRPEYHITEDVRSIRGIRFFSDQILSYSLEYVYIGPASAYFQDPRLEGALILANGQNHILCHGADTEELLNHVLSSFDYYNRMEQRLYESAVRHRPLEEMLAVIEEILPGTFLVFGLDGILLSYTHLTDLPDKDVLDSICQTNHIQSAVLGSTMVDKNGNISHDLTDHPLHLYRTRNQSNGCISMYLKQNQENVGFVMYFPVSKLDILLGLCLESFFAQYITESEPFSIPSAAYQSTHTTLIQLLKGYDIPSVLRMKLEKQLELTEDHTAKLIVFQTLAIQNYTLRNALRNEIEQSGIPCISCEFEEQGVILSRSDHMESLLRLILKKIPAHNISFGISLPIQNIKKLHTAYRQAFFALHVSTEPGVHDCQAHTLSHLISVLQKDELSRELIHPAVEQLKSYDQSHETDLYETLCCYLKYGCSQINTSQALHIHLNTLKYRLRRIRELTHIHFEDGDELLYLQISTRMLELPDGILP